MGLTFRSDYIEVAQAAANPVKEGLKAVATAAVEAAKIGAEARIEAARIEKGLRR